MLVHFFYSNRQFNLWLFVYSVSLNNTVFWRKTDPCSAASHTVSFPGFDVFVCVCVFKVTADVSEVKLSAVEQLILLVNAGVEHYAQL